MDQIYSFHKKMLSYIIKKNTIHCCNGKTFPYNKNKNPKKNDFFFTDKNFIGTIYYLKKQKKDQKTNKKNKTKTNEVTVHTLPHLKIY